MGGRPEGTTWMEQGNWTFCLGLEDGLHEEGKMGTGCTKKPNPVGSMYAEVASRYSLGLTLP
jgi:hypothetical protein